MFGGGIVGGGSTTLLFKLCLSFFAIISTKCFSFILGVYEIIQRYMKGKFQDLGISVEISKICVRDPSKPRDYTVSKDTKIVTDYEGIPTNISNCLL